MGVWRVAPVQSKNSFHIEFQKLDSFVYHLYPLFEIIYFGYLTVKSIFYNLKITLNYWFNSKMINARKNVSFGPCYP